MHPLDGIRVVECGVAIAGPLAARYLGHLGADVIKVDNRANTLGAAAPSWAPKDLGLAGADLVPNSAFNAEKRSLGLDLKAPEARPILESLVATADIFLTNLSMPAVDSLRLRYEDFVSVNPSLIYIALPGFGTSPGPYREYRSWGPNLSSLSGIDYLSGDPDRGPVMTPSPLPDYVGAYHAVTAILAALLHRAATGEGQEIRMSQFETTISVLGPQVLEAQISGTVPFRAGNRRPHIAPCDLFPCRGHDRWVAIEVAGDEDWQRLLTAPGLGPGAFDEGFRTHAGRVAHEQNLYAELSSWTAKRTDREAARLLQDAGIAAHPVQSSWDHLTDPQLEARGFWRIVAHDRMGTDLSARLPLVLSETPARCEATAPSFGHDTRATLQGEAGLSPGAIDDLVARGIAQDIAPIPPHIDAATLERPSRGWAWPLLRVMDHASPPEPKAPEKHPGGPATRVPALRVLDLSDELTAYGPRLLAMMGADVIRIEQPGGAPLRTAASPGAPSAAHAFLDAGKQSLALDIKSAAGRDEFLRLAGTCDIVYESLMPGRLDAFGLGWDVLHAANPGLSLVSVTPFGQDGPFARLRSGELGMWAASGMLPLNGFPDRRPVMPGPPLAANLIGTTGAVAALAAIYARASTGRGQRVDVSGQEVLVFTASTMLGQIEDLAQRQRSGTRALGAAPWGYFQCSDRLVSLLALFPNHWDILAKWISDETGDARALDAKYRGSPMNRYLFVDEIEALINALTARYAANEFCSSAQALGVPAMPVNSVADLLGDPHLQATGFWRQIEIPGSGKIRWPGPPFRIKDIVEPSAAPELGSAADWRQKPSS